LSFYLDTSAVFKLILAEKESEALSKKVRGEVFSSALAKLEVSRTIDRVAAENSLPDFQEVAQNKAHSQFNGINFVELDSTVLGLASSFQGLPYLGSLEAIHLASALLIKREISTFITYEKQLARAAELMGFEVAAPA